MSDANVKLPAQFTHSLLAVASGGRKLSEFGFFPPSLAQKLSEPGCRLGSLPTNFESDSIEREEKFRISVQEKRTDPFFAFPHYYGQSVGEAYASQGTSTPGLNGFVYNNNGGDFNALFTTAWSGPLTPDWAVDLHFNAVPEPGPGAPMLLGMGLLCGIGVLRRKLS